MAAEQLEPLVCIIIPFSSIWLSFSEISGAKRRLFNFPKAKSMDIPNTHFGMLKRGRKVELPDGRIIHPEEVLFPPDAPLSYSFCSDTRYSEALIPYIEGSTILYHEATFTEAFAERAKETFHTTASQAGNIARQAAVNHLLIGHFSARYRNLDELLQEAKAVFPNTDLAREGDLFKVKAYV